MYSLLLTIGMFLLDPMVRNKCIHFSFSTIPQLFVKATEILADAVMAEW